MIEMLANNSGLQNVFTPLPFNVHLVFCILATAIYLIQFARKKSIHYLLIMLAIDATFVTQFCTTSAIIAILFFVELFLLVAAGIFSHQYSKSLKENKKAEDTSAE